MKQCEQYEDMISAFIDGVLSEEDRRELMEHMAGCPDCQAYFDHQIAIHDALMDDAEHNIIEAPEGFTADVMARVRFAPQEKKPLRKAAVRWQRWAALAACCAIAAAGLWTARTPRDLAAENMQQQRPAVAAEEAATTTETMPETARRIPDTTAVETVEDKASAKMYEDTAMTGGTALSSAPPPMETELDAGDLPDAAAGMYVEPQMADQEQRLNGGGMQNVIAMPAPAAAAEVPEEFETADSYTVEGAMGAYRCVMTASGPAVRAWVEEQGLPWTEGGFYELSAEEYEQLRETLSEAGEEFAEKTSGAENSEGYLLIT